MVNFNGDTAEFKQGEQKVGRVREAVVDALQTYYNSDEIEEITRRDGTIILQAAGNEVTIETGPQGQTHVDFSYTRDEISEAIRNILESLSNVGDSNVGLGEYEDADFNEAVGTTGGGGGDGPSEAERERFRKLNETVETTGGPTASSDFTPGNQGNYGEDVWDKDPAEMDKGEVQAHGRGAITFVPEFTKQQAGYKGPLQAEGDSHSRCGDCAHYIEGGGCHLVQGGVNENGYCTELFSDISISGHKHPDGVEIPITIWGDGFNWTRQDMQRFAQSVKNKIEQKLGR
jgi:hypothetical protein